MGSQKEHCAEGYLGSDLKVDEKQQVQRHFAGAFIDEDGLGCGIPGLSKERQEDSREARYLLSDY